MAMDFPSSPTVGAIYQAPGGPAYKWDGTLWTPMVGAAALIVPGRNKIINGSMRVNQRALLSTTIAGAYVADRWSLTSSTTNATLANASDGSLSRQGPNYLTLTTTVVKASLAAGDFAGIRYIVEGYDAADLKWGTADAKPLTISFRASASVATLISLGVKNADNTRSYCAAVQLVAGQAEYQVTIPGCTTGVWDTTTGIGLQIQFWGALGSTFIAPAANVWNTTNYNGVPGMSNILDTLNRFIAIADVQAEVGLSATPFEFSSFAEMFAKARRYYKQFNVYGTVASQAGLYMDANNIGMLFIYGPELLDMRVYPTVSFRGTQGTDFYVSSSGGVAQTGFTITVSGTQLQCSKAGHGMVANQVNFTLGASGNSGIIMNAEL